MFQTLKIQAWMHQVAHLNVYQSSDFKDFHEKQTVNLTSSQLSKHSV